jgi:hypothetical protein
MKLERLDKMQKEKNAWLIDSGTSGHVKRDTARKHAPHPSIISIGDLLED